MTAAQIVALEKAKADKEAYGEFESESPGYCGAQNTFYIGTPKGVGRVYQQTVIDTYAKSPLPSSLTARPRSPRPRSATTGWCHFMTSTASGCRDPDRSWH